MHSTWLDNDNSNENSKYRIESASKKAPTNRIQVVSKINHIPQRNIPPPSYSSQNKIQQLNQTCGSTHLAFRRANTTDGSSDRNEFDKNLLKLMQQQLQLAKKAYQDKIKQQLKQYSMGSELSKLDIKIQNNNQLIAKKDSLIIQLQDQLKRYRKASPVKQGSPRLSGIGIPLSGNILQKVGDVQAKYAVFMETQKKLQKKVSEMNSKIQMVEKGLLSLLACKLANLQQKISEFADLCSHKISNIQINLLNKIKKQQGIGKNMQNQSNTQLNQSMDVINHKLQALRQEIVVFKTKQFRYENSNINILNREVTMLQSAISQLEVRFRASHSKLKGSKVSSKKNHSFEKKLQGSAQNSSYFDDYYEVYDQNDSVGQDQFFHPLQQSTRKYMQKQSCNPIQYRSNTKPTTHNDSFQNFTSDQQQDDTPNQKRLIHTLKSNGYKLPLHIEIDLTGYIRKKSDQKYLIDCEKKGFMLSQIQLNQCKSRGWIVW